MNSEEPPLAEQVQEARSSSILPEQAKIIRQSIPRAIRVTDLLYQWQPMGIRVKLDLPFVGDDRTAVFLIRNGPFIPRWDEEIYSTSNDLCGVYVWNNTRNVYLQPQGKITHKNIPQHLTTYPKEFPITMTQYDYPPVLSVFAEAFRRWNGPIHYRLQETSSFGNQGYVVVSIVKNEHMPIGVYNEYKDTPILTRKDFSYREMMTHAYQRTDISQFRHNEIRVDYDYAVPWYDQYQWIANRMPVNKVKGPGTDFGKPCVNQEWCGDNWIMVMVRGQLASQQPGSIFFELEYRAGEGFQFDEPGLPPQDMCRPYMAELLKDVARPEWEKIKTIPDTRFRSDGWYSVVSNDSYDAPYIELSDKMEKVKTHYSPGIMMTSGTNFNGRPGSAIKSLYPSLPNE